MVPQSPPPPTILEVFDTFTEIAETKGKGSRARKEALLRELLARATAVEAKFLTKVIYQEMRHGVSEGIMLAKLDELLKARLGVQGGPLASHLGEFLP